jgi:hypothetical protein
MRALFALMCVLVVKSAWAEEPVSPATQALLGDVAKDGAQTPLGQELLSVAGQSMGTAEALSQATELAISPLLTLSVLSAWRYLTADAAGRAALPFFCQPWCWGVGFFILALVLFKEVVIARIPGAKKPLDVLQVAENKISGLLASPLAIGALAWALHRAMAGISQQQVAGIFYASAWAADGAASAPLPSWLSWTFAVVGASVVYGSVWLASHTIDVLILLSPFGLVDNALKVMRLGLLGAVALLSKYVPTVGLVVCLGLVLVALLTAGFSYRLMRFGISFSLGFLKTAPNPQVAGRVFAYSGPRLGLPVRTSGWLIRSGDEIVFRYRRAFVVPRQIAVPASVVLEKGLFHAVVLDSGGGMVARLTPSAQGHEAEVAALFGAAEVREAPARRALASIGAWLTGTVRGEPMQA